MSPIVSLRFLTEPAYVLIGGVLPDDGTGEVRVVVSPESVVAYPEEARRLLEYFTVLRSRSDALAQIARWSGEARDLDQLIAAGLLLELPPNDEAAVREALSELTVRVTAAPALASDSKSVLLRLPSGRSVDIGLITAAVLDTPIVHSLDSGVRELAESADAPEGDIWRHVLHDLTGILGAGAGTLARTGVES